MTTVLAFCWLALLALRGEVRGQDSVTVLIVYHSEHGHTAALAEAVARGARHVRGAVVELLPVAQASPSRVLAADAVILGCPVHNANVTPALQAFINRWPFAGAPLRDKIGAAFVTAGGISAGEELVQMNILHAMLIFGMIVVGGPDWRSAFGASAVVAEEPFSATRDSTLVAAPFLVKGEALGRRVAEVALRWRRGGTR
ncbi:MAG: flavodoxin family protein [candidate division KSB1 bacterium]|nr:flavodoxin family protein [candidate division KSB1 bacterium]MDZ7274747.1 flavodoxin family protein [candidate division KSB1 bacterium]MDZ7285572.1 flavodoxin family protein [candidate division KSB1 bacterium]MDZ7298604.1 flavodoxin family protein [candidate division KSB1 bacterium]MDZ7306783.1 flavodoxin family protein [candidate division KSB1 bacterium]